MPLLLLLDLDRSSADDFWDLSLKGSRCCHERGNSCQLGNESGGSRDISNLGQGSGSSGDFLVMRRNSCRSLGLFYRLVPETKGKTL